jgi:5'-nucleotidase
MNGNEMEFVILHTNDLHSVFESMPRIRTLFQAFEKEQPPERLLRFDIGDHMDRMRVETEGTLGAANIEVMNMTGYDAAVPGNNEGLTLTADVLDELYGRLASFPVVATNLTRTLAVSPERAKGTDWNRRSLLLERSGVRFGIIGLTAAFNDFYKELGWQADDPFQAAAQESERLRKELGADVVIALSHLGLPHDRRLAAEVPSIDLILGGHTHHTIEELMRVGGTYVGAAGKFGSHLGVVRMRIDVGTRRVAGCSGGAIDATLPEPEPELAALIEASGAIAASALGQVVATLERSIPAADAEESPLGNLAAAALRRHCDAEVGVVNAGQLLDGLEAGPVTAARLHAICPSPVNPCLMRLRGDRLFQAIEESLQEAYIQKSIRGFGFRGKILGTLCFDGAEVEAAEGSSGAGPRVLRVTIGGDPLQPDRLYRIGTIDMFSFRIGYESLAAAEQTTYFLPEFLRDLLADTLASDQSKKFIREAWKARIFWRK